MLTIHFSNTDSSPFIKAAAREKIEKLVAKYPDLMSHSISLHLGSHNTAQQPGRDSFSAKVIIKGRKYGKTIVEKARPSLYDALDEVTHALKDYLNRAGDRTRVRQRRLSRDSLRLP